MTTEWNEQAERIIIALADYDPMGCDCQENYGCRFCGVDDNNKPSEAVHFDTCLWKQARRLMQKARSTQPEEA